MKNTDKNPAQGKFLKFSNFLLRTQQLFIALFKDFRHIFRLIKVYAKHFELFRRIEKKHSKTFHNIRSIFYRPNKILILIFLGLIAGTIAIYYLPYIDIADIEKKNITKKNDITIQPIFQDFQDETKSSETTIVAGDDLNSILKRLKIPANYQALIRNQNEYKIANENISLARNMVIGRKVVANFDAQQNFSYVDFYLSRKTALRIKPDSDNSDKIVYKQIDIQQNWEDQMGGGIINFSLYSTLDNSNIPPSIVSHIVDIFGTEIDFSKDVRKGDSVFVVYKRLFVNGVATPEVVTTAIELTVNKKKYYAILYPKFEKFLNSIQNINNEDEDDIRFQNGKFQNLARYYYDLDGTSVIRGFIRYPLEFTRISSGFTEKRFHPVLHKMRAHTGTDFAAPTGTPVRATADGKISFVGPRGGYGNAIVIAHNDGVETIYAHLSAFANGIKANVKVQQNQTIGYVGMTGLATGPHLHYEFRINGRPNNPLSVVLPKPPPISIEKNSEYKILRDTMLEKIGIAQKTLFVSVD